MLYLRGILPIRPRRIFAFPLSQPYLAARTSLCHQLQRPLCEMDARTSCRLETRAQSALGAQGVSVLWPVRSVRSIGPSVLRLADGRTLYILLACVTPLREKFVSYWHKLYDPRESTCTHRCKCAQLGT